MFVLIFPLFLSFAGAVAGQSNATRDQQVELHPSCDLVSVSYIELHKSRHGKDVLDFAWDRKNENYAQINGSIKNYVVRHGPLEDGKLSNNSKIVFGAPSKSDAIELFPQKSNVKYGIQICAVAEGEKIQENIWEHAWLGQFDLSNAEFGSGRKLKIENNNFLPRCNLVQTSYVGTLKNTTTHSLDVSLSWNEKPTSYEKLKTVHHYRVRHGVQASWGVPIKESDAHYFDAANETSIELPAVPYGSFYGVQICAMENKDNDEINWQRDAWLGSMDFTGYHPPQSKPTHSGDHDDNEELGFGLFD